LVAFGCAGDGAPAPDPGGSTTATASEQSLETLDARDQNVLVGRRAPLMPESDAPPEYELWLRGPASVPTPIATGARSAVLGSDAVFVVGSDGVLRRIRDGRAVTLVDRVLGRPALRGDREIVVARAGDEPGESDLFLVDEVGQSRALAPARGPDDLPVVLPDRRVVFVSGRTTVASLFVVDPDTGALEQLTNRGLVAGRGLSGFVPPPARSLEFFEGALRYDAGHGDHWQVQLETGRAERIGGGR
jgi:TolB protein